MKKCFDLQLLSITWFAIALFAIVSVVAHVGCHRNDGPGKKTNTSTAESAKELLNRMVQRYATAENYQDQATFRLSYRLHGKPHEETHRFQTQWNSQYEFHVKWFKSRMTGESNQLVCRVVDIPSENMDHQVVLQQQGEVGAFDAILEDPIARHFICGTSDLPWAPDVQTNPNDQIPPTWTLLTNQHKPLWLRSYTDIKLLPDALIDGSLHYRLEIDTLLGEYIAWINQETMLLRRLEIPQGVMARELNYTSDVTRIQIVADFHDAQIDSPQPAVADVDREMLITDMDKPVRYFVTLPEKFPSRLIGSRVREFRLQALRGADVDWEFLKGNISVMLWFSGVAHQAVCQDFKKVCSRFVEFEDVRCYGVCADPANMADDQAVVNRVLDWNLNFPVVRDLQPVGGSVFDVRTLPTIVVIGPDGRVQYHTTGDETEFIEDTIAAVDRLKQGDDIAAEMQQQYDAYVLTYRKQIAALNPLASNNQLSAIEVKLRRQTRPEKLRLDAAWQSDELVAPGNLLVTGSEKQQRLFANDGWRTVVELDTDGKVIARHSLDLPEGAAVSWIRAGADRQGNQIFVACSMLQQQVFVFDQKWRKLLAYPESPSEDSAIADVQFINGTSTQPTNLLVAFAKQGGVHRIDLKGALIAESKPYTGLTSIAVVNHDPHSSEIAILATLQDGDPIRLNSRLQATSHAPEQDSSVVHVFSGRTKNGNDPVSILTLGKHDDVALHVEVRHTNLQTVGSLDVYPGSFRDEVQFVCFADVLSQESGVWFVARPDGSIYLISSNGKLLDSFQYGKAIRGIAVARDRANSRLYISTPDGIEAWNLTYSDGSRATANMHTK